jgi:hypothetical protein
MARINDKLPPSSPVHSSSSEELSDSLPARRKPRQDKGKGKEVIADDTPLDSTGLLRIDPSEDENEEDRVDGWKKKSGPLSRDALDAIKTFSVDTLARADGLGRKFGKGRREILTAAGLGSKSTRKENRWNMYRSWYFAHHKKPADSKLKYFFVCSNLTNIQ